MAKCKTLVGFGVNDVEYTVKWKTSCGKEFVLPEYNAWKGCITRCYGKTSKASASYVNTSVCEAFSSDFFWVVFEIFVHQLMKIITFSCNGLSCYIKLFTKFG